MVIRYSDIVIDREQNTISIGAHRYEFKAYNTSRSYVRKGTSVAFETFSHLLLNGHTTRRQMFDLVYGHDAEGGPIDGPSIFDIHFVNWAHIFSALHVTLAREWKLGVQYLYLKRL